MDNDIVVYCDDLSLETLESIKNDMAKYGHLKAYENTFKTLCDAITERKEHDTKPS